MEFKELNLSDRLLKIVEKENYKETTPIQELVIPHILNNEDVIGIAQTGTGKTAAYLLPIVESLTKSYKPDNKIKVLILSPTRELALQIRDNVKTFISGTPFRCSVVLGGMSQSIQTRNLQKGVDILVATPGRLIDFMSRGIADLSNVKMLVLDEADTMLDMGFIKDVRKIIESTPKTRQSMLFSATISKEVEKISKEFLNKPEELKVKSEAPTVDKIHQYLYRVDKKNKNNLILDIIGKFVNKTAIIFTRTKIGANKLNDELSKYDIKCSVIHGDKTQQKRSKALNQFKNGKTHILIATDIAARGIDINNLDYVINYDLPEQAEVYIHRIGRTARAGAEGTSISFCSNEELEHLYDIEKLIKKEIEEVEHQYPVEEPKKRLSLKENSKRRNSTRKELLSRKTSRYSNKDNKSTGDKLKKNDKGKYNDSKSNKFDKDKKYSKFDKKSNDKDKNYSKFDKKNNDKPKKDFKYSARKTKEKKEPAWGRSPKVSYNKHNNRNKKRY